MTIWELILILSFIVAGGTGFIYMAVRMSKAAASQKTTQDFENMAEKAAIPGKNLILTIDQDVQIAAAKAFGEKIGSVVAIDPRAQERPCRPESQGGAAAERGSRGAGLPPGSALGAAP